MKTKRIFQSGLLVLTILTVTACSANTESSEMIGTTDANTEETVADNSILDDNEILEESTESDPSGIVSEEESEAEEDPDRENILAAYQQALTQLYEEQLFPDGTEAEYDSEFYDISQNQFAVYDIDQDGEDELIILYTTCSTAGMTARIYDYDEETDSLYPEITLFPSLTFYDNGTLEEAASHNQGYAGEFWPYTLYVYDSVNDTYQAMYYADAWDRNLSETDDYGNAFPEDADEDGDGIVYYILPYGEYDYDDPMDWDAYETWHTSAVGNELGILYYDLTPENIAEVE